MVDHRGRSAQAGPHAGGGRRAGSQARRDDRRRRRPRATSAVLRWAARWPERTFAARGLPPSLPAASSATCCSPGERVVRVAAQADGRGPPLGARARQERPHRRARGRPRGPARAGPAGRRSSRASSATSASSSTIARTSSPSARASSSACAGTSTNWCRARSPLAAPSTEAASSTALEARLADLPGTVARIARELVGPHPRADVRHRRPGAPRSPHSSTPSRRPCSRSRAAAR